MQPGSPVQKSCIKVLRQWQSNKHVREGSTYPSRSSLQSVCRMKAAPWPLLSAREGFFYCCWFFFSFQSFTLSRFFYNFVTLTFSPLQGEMNLYCDRISHKPINILQLPSTQVIEKFFPNSEQQSSGLIRCCCWVFFLLKPFFATTLPLLSSYIPSAFGSWL